MSTPWEVTVKCDGGWQGCKPDEVTYLDHKGFAYCTSCGLNRQQYQRCRKLRPHELNRLKRGLQIARY